MASPHNQQKAAADAAWRRRNQTPGSRVFDLIVGGIFAYVFWGLVLGNIWANRQAILDFFTLEGG